MKTRPQKNRKFPPARRRLRRGNAPQKRRRRFWGAFLRRSPFGGNAARRAGGTSGFSAVGFSAFCPSLGKYRTRTLALQKRRVQVRFHPKGCQAFCILFMKRISCKPFRLFQGSSEITPVNSVSRHKILAECLPNFPLSHKKYFFSAFKSTARRMCVSSAL